MKPTYLNHNWQVTKPKFNYWQMISYLIFIAFIFTSFCCVMADSKLRNTERDKAYLQAENTNLKLQIAKGNAEQFDRDDLEDEVLKASQ